MTAFKMQPSYYMFISTLPCDEREKMLKEIIEEYSMFHQKCEKAKQDLSDSIIELMRIKEQNDEIILAHHQKPESLGRC